VKRLISHSEIERAMACWASWDFSYGGHLAGTALRRKEAHVRLREGRAWGRAVAALHGAVESASGEADPVDGPARTQRVSEGHGAPGTSAPTQGLQAYVRGLRALNEAIDEDADTLREHGLYIETEHHDMAIRLGHLLAHYSLTSAPLQVHSPELELRVPLPSRTGKSISNRYVFHGYIDGLTEIDGRLWIVEYKLRGRLTSFEDIVRSRQPRRYAWAAEQQLDRPVAGVIVDERLNEVPKAARWVKGKKKTDAPLVPSHAKDQMTTRELYEAACAEAGVDVDSETAVVLGQRHWQNRHMILFRRSEIEEAGRELVSAAQVIAQLDSAVLFPVRNTSPQRCAMCSFSQICSDPGDADLVDLHFSREVPKRDRADLVPLPESSAA
jgi:hypothetical protein